MQEFNSKDLKNLFVPNKDSHKGQNGKLMIIGGSKLFHAASLWSLKVASRIVDMVFYSSVPENNEIVQKVKEEFRDGIVIPRNKIANYINEADCVLIGPGMPRKEGEEEGDDDTKVITEYLLKSSQNKKWVIDGGSLQTINPSLIPQGTIITPHTKEFEKLFNFQFPISNFQSNSNDQISKIEKIVQEKAKKYNCVVLLKGSIDIVSNGEETVRISGGNAGMTKGGTGDVLAGLVAALYCKNDAFLAACAGSYINKKTGEKLAEKMGLYFNASDLADEIPKVMKNL
ncbi:MAG: NAD(P)H-hydrate dehydratase [Candidatus Levybacteria bacterium CG_4_9_14_3_um_filter_35_16]|nr:MAG: NAD(P)H-hydrate dehydratase [Candidatus Levybacteria bacterium CG22_combo_CG10-13_8_21_14_all_35_11]PIY95130.1 MAG: NAD(P)H-hydrate dehydratase [Candidatus Levybacteria bacterium CG_4_10_14_0_8_um_filter_35_23]PJA91029.1 MAG: NAD(P)H-hydrate dehydratase [Candidatus Levybacteria bacterium CG_4_9_14_3_um_filter_35_16]PJC54734.1 MAG: NAD(P)H-hydrate dehydratase [Candidatus Levybacteria bacterium CG_4_9_14_0_2_um_filter_35_21]